MASRLEVLAELDRRGKLPQEYRTAFEEAKRRGLVDGGQTAPAPAAPEASAAPAEPSLADQIMGAGKYGLETAVMAGNSAVDGLLNVAGLPVDAINAAPMLANFIPGVDGVGPIAENPVGGQKSLKDLFRLGGAIPELEPRDLTQRFISRVAEDQGAMLIPGVGTIKAAEAIGLPAIREMSKFALTKPETWGSGLARSMLEPAAVNPMKFGLSEAGITAGSSGGAVAANELTGNQDRSNPWIDLAGALGGAGLFGVGGPAIRATGEIFGAMTGSKTLADDVVKEAVMGELARSSGIVTKPGEAPDLTPLISQVEEGKRVGDVVPGFQETLADRTGNKGLADLEYGRQSLQNSGSWNTRRASNAAVVDAAMQGVEPQGTPGAFSSALDQNRTAALSEVAANTSTAQTAFDQAIAGLQPALTAEARGANIRDALTGASDQAKEVLSQAWKPVDQAAETVDMKTLKDTMGGVDDSLSMAERDVFRPDAANIPDRQVTAATTVDAAGNKVVPETVDKSLSELTGIRSVMTDAQRAATTAGESNKARVIGEYIDALDNYMEDSLSGELLDQYHSAKAATLDYNNRFTRPQTAIGQTLATQQNQPRTPASAIPGKFVQSDQGRIADFEALMKEAGSDERVQSAVRDQILQDVKDRALLDKPEALNAYLDQYGAIFAKFPGLKKELGDAGTLRGKLVDAQKAEADLQKLLNGNSSEVGKYLRYGNEKATSAMEGVLGAKDPSSAMDELLNFVGNEAGAVEGARKAFWNVMAKRSRSAGRTTAQGGIQPWSPESLKQFLDNPSNAAVAERLYRDNPEHLGDIRAIVEALQGVDTRLSARAPNASGTGQTFSQLMTPEAIQSRIYAWAQGRIGGTFLITSFASVLARRAVRAAQSSGYQRMLDEVLLNPDTAALLMKENNPVNRAAFQRRAKLWWGNEASTIVNAMSAEDKPDETVQAATSNAAPPKTDQITDGELQDVVNRGR